MQNIKTKIIAVLPKSIIVSLKFFRKVVFLLLEPVDFIARLINGKKDFPPLSLRRYVGPLRGFEASGSEFLVYLKLLGKIKPATKILDIGCGCGLIGLFLKDYLNEQGQYTGVDIHMPSIKWCQKKFTRDSNYVFQHIDVKNNVFNPRGQYSTEEFSFPFVNNSFNFILLKSVFTHLDSAGLNNYLREVARLLTDKEGLCLATFFLLNTEQRDLADKGVNRLNFVFGDEVCRFVYKNSPESAIAYDENYILQLLANHNLALADSIYYGTWSGRKCGISYQDMLLIKK